MMLQQSDRTTGEEAGPSVAKTLRRILGSRWLAVVRWLATVAFALAGVIVAIQGQQLFLARPAQEDAAINHYVIGAILFALAFVWQVGNKAETVAAPAVRINARLFWFLGWAALLNAFALLRFQRDENSNTAWWLFLASLIVLVGGVASSQRARVDGPARALRDRVRAFGRAASRWLFSWRGLEIVLLLGIVGLASALRFLRLDSFPEGVWFDEAEYGLLVRRILIDDSFRPIYAPSANMAAPFLYFIAATFKVFGDDIISLRLVSALAGHCHRAGLLRPGAPLCPGTGRDGGNAAPRRFILASQLQPHRAAGNPHASNYGNGVLVPSKGLARRQTDRLGRLRALR